MTCIRVIASAGFEGLIILIEPIGNRGRSCIDRDEDVLRARVVRACHDPAASKQRRLLLRHVAAHVHAVNRAACRVLPVAIPGIRTRLHSEEPARVAAERGLVFRVCVRSLAHARPGRLRRRESQ